MGTVKKGSYPSRQIRAGPAPLASFEDLMSDEMDSPDNGKIDDGDTGSVKLVGVDGYTIGDAETPTPGTLTPNGLDSPQEDVFICGNVTPTPSQSATPTFDVIEEADSGMCSGGHITSTLQPESAAPLSESQRKGSWTDIFHPRGRSRSRSCSPHHAEGDGRLLSPSSPVPHFKGKDDSEYAEDETGRKRKDRKGFFTSIFKLSGRKSPGKELISPVKHSHTESLTTPTEGKILNQMLEESKAQVQNKDVAVVEKTDLFVERSASKASGLHLPLQEAQVGNNELMSQTRDSNGIDSSSITVEHSSSINVKNEHCQPDVVSKMSVMDAKENDPLTSSSKTERPDSSESELEFDTKAIADSLKKTDSDEDFEAATLLVQDSMEYEDTSICELPPPLPPPVDTTKTLVKTPTRRQRLEVITIPIERPRSTTPINIAPLEAFLQTASPSSDCGGEKIKLSLPGEKFTSRPRSPRKGNPKSWFDFCEEGLQSPRSHRRQSAAKDGSQTLDDSTPLSDGGDKTFPLTPETDLFLQDTDKQQWTTFGSFKDESELVQTMQAARLQEEISVDQAKFSDRFEELFDSDTFAPSHDLAKNQWHPSDCTCECHSCSCICHYDTVEEHNGIYSSDSSRNQKVQVSKQITKHINDMDTCPCECHCQVLPQVSNEKEAYCSSSDISSSSRHCSADSSPSPYSSPDEQEFHGPKNMNN